MNQIQGNIGNPHPCSSCGSKELSYGNHDTTRIYEGNPITVSAVGGWLCGVCGELEFDDSEAAKRYFDQASKLQQEIKSLLSGVVVETLGCWDVHQ